MEDPASERQWAIPLKEVAGHRLTGFHLDQVRAVPRIDDQIDLGAPVIAAGVQVRRFTEVAADLERLGHDQVLEHRAARGVRAELVGIPDAQQPAEQPGVPPRGLRTDERNARKPPGRRSASSPARHAQRRSGSTGRAIRRDRARGRGCGGRSRARRAPSRTRPAPDPGRPRRAGLPDAGVSRRVSSASESGRSVPRRTRPASDWEMHSISRRLRDPDSRSRPGAESSSTIVWMYENSSGARWASSRMAGRVKRPRKPRGSSSAKAGAYRMTIQSSNCTQRCA